MFRTSPCFQRSARSRRTSPENSLTDLDQYGSDEEENGVTYLSQCACGHGPQQHGADEEELDKEEYTRRANLALRIEQHLEVRLSF
jgi:hypothetical protein